MENELTAMSSGTRQPSSNWVDAAVAVAVGVAVGAFGVAFADVYVAHDYDPKFADARGIPFFITSLFIGALGLVAGELFLVGFWRLRQPKAQYLSVSHYI